jgi:hypothetical protein
MHEPRRGQRDRLQAVLVADAALRRIAGRLAALSVDLPASLPESSGWVPETLQAIAEGQPWAPRPQASGADDRLERVSRQVELLGRTLAREPE